MDTQKDEQTAQDLETTDLEKDTGEETKLPEEEEKEVLPKEEETEEDKWQKKFEKQSSSAQRTITEAHERLYKTSLKLAKKDDDYLVELSNGDDKEIKVAKQIAKELYDLPLETVIQELRPKDESKEDLEKRLRLELEREVNHKASYNLFTKSHSILDEKSSEYDEDMKVSFEARVKRLRGDDIMTLDESQEILEDAYYLVSREGKDPAKAQEKIATAGSGGTISNQKTTPSKLYREIDEDLAAAGFSPLSEEVKKLMKQGKL